MTNPVLIEVTRGQLVESWHRGSVAVAAPSGALALALGDVASPVYPRSAVKALAGRAADRKRRRRPLRLRSRRDRARVRLARRHRAARDFAASMLIAPALPRWACLGAHAPLGVSAANALIAAGETPTQLHNNCSGNTPACWRRPCICASRPRLWHQSHQRAAARPSRAGRHLGCRARGRSARHRRLLGANWAMPLSAMALSSPLGPATACRPSGARRLRVFSMPAGSTPHGGGGRARRHHRDATLPGQVFMKTGAEGVDCGALPRSWGSGSL